MSSTPRAWAAESAVASCRVRLVPVALANGHPGQPLAREHDVLEVVAPLRHREGFEEGGARAIEIARRRLHLTRVLPGDHAALGEAERVVDGGRASELVGRRREVAHAQRQHAQSAVGVAQSLEVPGDSGARHRLLEGHPGLAQAAVRLENVAPARFDAREAPVLMGRAQQRGGSVHGRERAVVVAAEALQQTGRLETMPGQLPLPGPLRHRGAFADERRAVVLASNALVQTTTAEILGAVTAVAGRQQRPHGVERSVEGGRVAAPRIGEANERGYLRRSIVQPPRLRDGDLQQRVGAADFAPGVGHPVEPEAGLHRPAVRAIAGAGQQTPE